MLQCFHANALTSKQTPEYRDIEPLELKPGERVVQRIEKTIDQPAQRIDQAVQRAVQLADHTVEGICQKRSN